jgi:hypothetical protein
MDERNEQLKIVSNRLVWSLAVLVAVGICGAIIAFAHHRTVSSPVSIPVPTPIAVLFVGFVGGFVGLQRRLKALPPEDLTLLANSWVCIALSPIAGAVLAVLVYLIFCSGLLGGNLFPAFVPDNKDAPIQGLPDMFAVHCTTGADYAKVLFWSFIAGFSEKFATNIIGQFESRTADAGLNRKPAEASLNQTPQSKPGDEA